MLLLVSGFKNYVKFQYVMWYATLLSFGLMLYLFFTATPESFAQKLDAFVTASGGAPNFYQTAIDAAKAANIDLNPPFSLLATLLVAPIAWTSLQWATYSAQQNGEIKGARSFQNQLVIILGSLIATGVLLASWRRPSSMPSAPSSSTWRAPAIGRDWRKASSTASFSGRTSWPWRSQAARSSWCSSPSATSSTPSRSSTTAISA